MNRVLQEAKPEPLKYVTVAQFDPHGHTQLLRFRTCPSHQVRNDTYEAIKKAAKGRKLGKEEFCEALEALQCPIDAEFVFQVLMVDFSERDDAVLVGDLEVLQIGRQVPEIEDPIAMCK